MQHTAFTSPCVGSSLFSIHEKQSIVDNENQQQQKMFRVCSLAKILLIYCGFSEVVQLIGILEKSVHVPLYTQN